MTPGTLPAPIPRRLGWADALILTTVLIWGVNFIVAKAALATFDALAFNALRYTLAVGFEIMFLVSQGQNLAMPWSDLRRLIPLAVMGTAGFQMLFILGLQWVPAGRSAVLMATMPMFVALYTGVFRRERLGRYIWLGAFLSFAGIFVMTATSLRGAPAGELSLLGSLMLVGSAACWAGYTFGSRSFLQVYTPLKVTTLSMLITLPILTLTAIPALQRTDWTAIPTGAWLGVAYSGILSLALSYLMWNIGVKRLGDARASIYSNLQPIVSLLAAWAILGERMGTLQFVGAGVVMAGIWLARLARPAAPNSVAPAAD